ncbi:YARHG domain-containing protein [Mucilaginibacter yixingensis]|uniref:YARHG domain-containing protein n=1 Tax=Mucilaginibacter yixingensis TaxID=1295612 RepID=A0A2T5JE30_9SPHI|nr:YARHG domain-containing protein [Mucilaginibacter yixingensis]PTR00019.1 YARHG domain-containing protein [Mucilaginibacter yixingensis]
MKTKPYPTLIAAALLLAGITLFTHCKSKTDNTNGITQFLTLFSLQVKSAQTDSLVQAFNMPTRRGEVARFVNLICGKSGSVKDSKPIFKLDLDIADCTITTVTPEVSTATFSVNLHRDSIETRSTMLTFRIKKTGKDNYKIVDVDTKKFLGDYIDYENLVHEKTLTDKDIYSPQTLAAFAAADSLKAQYDTIPWFQHLNGKTYFFVVKGDKNFDVSFYKDTVLNYQMGLVGPGRKEIVPAAFDLVHNIGATYPTLIEVEKSHKRGFYSLDGKLVLPVVYDQIFPLNDAANLAVLRKGDDYYWWKNDYTVTDKDPGIQIANLLPRIKNIGQSFTLKNTSFESITEHNSREEHNSVYLPPSYLVDLGLMPTVESYINPLRRNVFGEGATQYSVKTEEKNTSDNWFTSIFYSIRDYFVGGRGEFYDRKKIILANKKNNRIYGADVSTDFSEDEDGINFEGKCNVNSIRQLNDTLFEARTAGNLQITLYTRDYYVCGGPGYHYLVIKNNKLVELPNHRKFGFTKYVQMDDSYLNACYTLDDKTSINKVNTEMLRYMKNEIYADYKYHFKDTTWNNVFQESLFYNYAEKDKYNDNVDDSLTAIDKYNLAFINKKLNAQQASKKALAAK